MLCYVMLCYVMLCYVMGNDHPEAVLGTLEGLGTLVFSSGFQSHFSSCSRRSCIPCIPSHTRHLRVQDYSSLEVSYFASHAPVGSTQLGSLPVVTRFMKGVFKMNLATALRRTLRLPCHP